MVLWPLCLCFSDNCKSCVKGNNSHFSLQDIMLAMDQVVEVAVHTHQPTLVTALAQIQIMVVPTIPHTKVKKLTACFHIVFNSKFSMKLSSQILSLAVDLSTFSLIP